MHERGGFVEIFGPFVILLALLLLVQILVEVLEFVEHCVLEFLVVLFFLLLLH